MNKPMNSGVHLKHGDIAALLIQCVERTIREAQNYVQDKLPSEVRFSLGVRTPREEDLSLDEAASRLFLGGQFPRLVDVGLIGIYDGSCVIWLRPSDHPLTSKIEETWNDPPGAGPFKAVGLALPMRFAEEKSSFRLHDLEEALRR